jgi:type VI secretion system protein
MGGGVRWLGYGALTPGGSDFTNGRERCILAQRAGFGGRRAGNNRQVIMAIQRTLLERLRDPGAPGQRELRPSESEIQASIIENLRRVLNTCQGNCHIDQSYGLPHLSTVRSTMPDSLHGLEAAIRTTIERHEPRLSSVTVRHRPDPEGGLGLRFVISGLIVGEDQRARISLETYADEDGRVTVR